MAEWIGIFVIEFFRAAAVAACMATFLGLIWLGTTPAAEVS